MTETLKNVKRSSTGEFVFADKGGHRFGDIKSGKNPG